jgi:hypothetical protein
MRDFKQSEATAAYRRIYFRLISSADGVTPVTGKVTADFTLAWEKNGVTATPGGTITEVGSGLYYYEASAGDLDTKGSIILTPSATGAYTFSYEGLVQANDFYTAAPTAPNNFSAMLIDGAGKVTTGTTADSSGVTTLLSRLSATRAGYLDALAVAGLVASQTDVQGLQFNTRVDVPIPPQLIRPATGSPAIVYQVPINLYDSVGNMEAPDSTPTLTAALADGTSLNANVGALTNPGTGRYLATYTIADTHPKSQVIFTLTVVEGGVTRTYTRSFVVVEDILLSFTLSDRGKLDAIMAQTDLLPADPAGVSDLPPDVSTNVAAIKLKTDTLPANPAAVGSAMTLEAGERTNLASAIANHVETAGALSLDEIGQFLQVIHAGSTSGATANGGTIVWEHPTIPGWSLTFTADKYGNRASAGTLVKP